MKKEKENGWAISLLPYVVCYFWQIEEEMFPKIRISCLRVYLSSSCLSPQASMSTI